MQPAYSRRRVNRNAEVSKGIFHLSVEGEYSPVPGQFYMLRAWGMEPLLSRPVSIHDVDEKSISFLYEVKGEGTRLLGRLSSGDSIELLGPLGNGFNVKSIQGRVAVVSGGIGIAPMLYLVKSMNNNRVDLFAGFREDVYTVDKFKGYVENIYISTDSGSAGYKGYITDILNPGEYSYVLCCGPEIMMKKTAQKSMECGVPVYLSMERHMACGIGACLVCTCKTKEGNKRACKDGPVFPGEDVIFDAGR